MSIDDDYFDLEDAIKRGELGDDCGPAITRILAALSDQEKLTMALQEKVRLIEDHTNGELWDKADLLHQVKTLTRRLKRLEKEAASIPTD